jgi:hypothetical protein
MISTARTENPIFSLPLSISIVKQEPFVKLGVVADEVEAEYRLDGERLQIHLFADEFPAGFGVRLARWASSYSRDAVVDFVPEVQSWYVEIRFGSMVWSQEYAERKIREI